ncbi:uncharacterized protein I303_104795 [Kwoniella dejecticola CBS 10117]|uniref:Uncharacterized protein n=1 Tax=Kwoniella dejecticola CBS 10117 TaxID=1296121 RepID=A0A1A6A4B5_9TREE|nr:uncharacterized protein I303_04224 [Kwoniella dejecticola CBS 10117]OBR84902.1 hypothetical protein I303_04224 [Kwoniella dejecticola CBS 10117]
MYADETFEEYRRRNQYIPSRYFPHNCASDNPYDGPSSRPSRPSRPTGTTQPPHHNVNVNTISNIHANPTISSGNNPSTRYGTSNLYSPYAALGSSAPSTGSRMSTNHPSGPPPPYSSEIPTTPSSPIRPSPSLITQPHSQIPSPRFANSNHDHTNLEVALPIPVSIREEACIHDQSYKASLLEMAFAERFRASRFSKTTWYDEDFQTSRKTMEENDASLQSAWGDMQSGRFSGISEGFVHVPYTNKEDWKRDKELLLAPQLSREDKARAVEEAKEWTNDTCHLSDLQINNWRRADFGLSPRPY